MTRSCTKFKRREGTAGILGHLYETKLISLFYFRAIHEEAIEEFQLASNVDKVGAFDDICFKTRVTGFEKPISVFIQAKHRENKNQTLEIDLATYFISYLNIRKHFDPKNEDSFFKSTYDEAECLFVIYTTAKDEIGNSSDIASEYTDVVYDLIGTAAGGTVKQPDQQEERVNWLCEIAMKEQMIQLADRMCKCIDDEINLDNLLSDELMLRYHYILAQQVLHVDDLQPDGETRVATFRADFFDNYENYLTVFKDSLYKEILKRRTIDTNDIARLLNEYLTDPTDVTKLSKVNKQYNEYYTPDLKRLHNVSHVTVEQATDLAARQILSELQVKVPAAFGNKDLTLCSNENRKKRRIKHLITKITEKLENCQFSKIVAINESSPKEFLELNGGLAGAIGNIFVLDDETKLMKITDNFESLETNAKLLYESLNKEIELINKTKQGHRDLLRAEEQINLRQYRFSFNVYKFPKVLLEYNEYEKHLARDFLNKLIIYSSQADEKTVEKKLKAEIEESLTLNDSFYAKIDEIFLKYHNEIQDWWLKPKEADYLTKDGELFKNATRYMIADPLTSSLSVPFVRLMRQYNYTFTDDALHSLGLSDQELTTIVVAEYSTLTVAKVMQYLKNKDYAALDIAHIARLEVDMRNALRRELSFTNENKVLIFVCDDVMGYKNKRALKNIAEAVLGKRCIIIANQTSAILLQRYFRAARTVCDERNGLMDLSEDCRRRVFANAGVEVELEQKDMRVELKAFVGA
ncbi:hypothetical protein PYW07_013457 [Mythimna separata]|uniref:Uncharacterized protein n=1 Tax=Mythimna separata TaxID=271217 RepID=A0AAD7Y6H8_MYTSE|nr:hypothetical protein PYW07_013457 [Mythimna separata]